jgi:hypothetical protein
LVANKTGSRQAIDIRRRGSPGFVVPLAFVEYSTPGGAVELAERVVDVHALV